eukprot:914435-Prymnesium_polylepis.1
MVTSYQSGSQRRKAAVLACVAAGHAFLEVDRWSGGAGAFDTYWVHVPMLGVWYVPCTWDA